MSHINRFNGRHKRAHFWGWLPLAIQPAPNFISSSCWFPLSSTLTKSGSSFCVCHCTFANQQVVVSFAEFHDCLVVFMCVCVCLLEHISVCVICVCVFGVRSELGGMLSLTVTPQEHQKSKDATWGMKKGSVLQHTLQSEGLRFEICFCHSTLYSLSFPPLRKHIISVATSQCYSEE